MNKPKNYLGDAPGQHFHQVIALHELPSPEWERLSQQIPQLPRGWYELSQLPAGDRIEFTRDYWLSKLPFMIPNASTLKMRLKGFFGDLEDIGFFATQLKEEGPFEVHMVYSLEGGKGFLQGSPPASKVVIAQLAQQFGQFNLPSDYLFFLQIHDGFSKYTDTGLIKTREMARIYQRFQHRLRSETGINSKQNDISPEAVVPFYESFGLHCYQCFCYADWYPEEEMRNIYFSEFDRLVNTFSFRHCLKADQAFPTFLNWLLFYLEDS